MTCWYCYWGWAEPVVEIYNRWAEKIGSNALYFGPGHCVWADENFETEMIQACIDDPYPGEDFSAEDFAGAINALKELLAVPEHIRCCEPADYDGEHPENFPPAVKTCRPRLDL